MLIAHLGMSGSFRIELPRSGPDARHLPSPASKAEAHDHVVFHLRTRAGGTARVVFNDPRRFGFMLLLQADVLDTHPLLAGLGVEPTGNTLDGALINTLFLGKRTPLKAALLDQRLIAGLGNIYVCEALWRSGLSPRRSAGSITSARRATTRRTEALADDIRTTIAEAIEAGGSSLRD